MERDLVPCVVINSLCSDFQGRSTQVAFDVWVLFDLVDEVGVFAEPVCKVVVWQCSSFQDVYYSNPCVRSIVTGKVPPCKSLGDSTKANSHASCGKSRRPTAGSGRALRRPMGTASTAEAPATANESYTGSYGSITKTSRSPRECSWTTSAAIACAATLTTSRLLVLAKTPCDKITQSDGKPTAQRATNTTTKTRASRQRGSEFVGFATARDLPQELRVRRHEKAPAVGRRSNYRGPAAIRGD